MKYIKKYEELNQNEPEINDYIIVYDIDNLLEIKNKIGQITNDFPDSNQSTYKSIFDGEIWWIMRRDIKYWSKNKEDLEQILLSKKKFNI